MHKLSSFPAGEPQIFVDDTMIARKEGVVRRVHACRKLAQPVLSGREPWEPAGADERAYLYGTILPDTDGDGFRMWYMRHPDRVLYATSKDGIQWERPALNLLENQRAGSNTLPVALHSPSVIIDEREPDPQKRYKMLGAGSPYGTGYRAAYSHDGLQWQAYDINPVLPGSDTCTLSQDPVTGAYMAFHKRYHDDRGHLRRLVYLATSMDMQHWSEPVLVMAPDETDDRQTQAEGGQFSEFYNMSAFPYAGQWLGLITHFRYSGPPQETGPEQSQHDGPIDVQLVHSRDGRTWHRCEDRRPVIPNGPNAFDAGCILGVANQPVFVGEDLWIYYTGITTTHGGYLPRKACTIARASWRLDGWVSLEAGTEEGVVETVAIHLPGDRLLVNAEAGRGTLIVEVTDDAGKPLPGYSFADCHVVSGDGVRQAVTWQKHRTLPMHSPVRLRFRLKNAQLYSYLFAS